MDRFGNENQQPLLIQWLWQRGRRRGKEWLPSVWLAHLWTAVLFIERGNAGGGMGLRQRYEFSFWTCRVCSAVRWPSRDVE